MDKKEFIQNYVNNMKSIQEIILDFLENNASYEELLQKFWDSLNNEKIRESRNDLRLVLRIISHIATYHIRTKGFILNGLFLYFLWKKTVGKTLSSYIVSQNK